MKQQIGYSNIPLFRLAALGCVTMLFFADAAAGESTGREQGAHVHGLGSLNIAFEGQTLEAELVSPGMDIVGFEHAAESAEDKEALAKATTTLKDGGALFGFPAEAGCRLEEAEVKSPSADGMQDDHDHEADHKHEGDHEGETHSEFRAHYHFHCQTPGHLTHIDVKFFDLFPNARELDVQTISTRGQGAVELTPAASRLTF